MAEIALVHARGEIERFDHSTKNSCGVATPSSSLSSDS